MPETTLISLKGRLREYGPRLEHAPADLVYVGRKCTMGGWRLDASEWANPYTVKMSETAQQAVEFYRSWLVMRPDLIERARCELAGTTLACWCKPGAACHGAFLRDIANGVAEWPPADSLGECGVADAPVRLRHVVTVRLRPEAASLL